MAEKTHCDRCDEVITEGYTNRLITDMDGRLATEVSFLPIQLAEDTGHLVPLRITLKVDREIDGWEGVDLCRVCWMAVLEAFYQAHQGVIGAGRR